MANAKKNVLALGFVSFFTDISSEMILPILPLFLTNVLLAPLSIVGLIEGIAESTASLLKLFSGWLSDRLRKRKDIMVIGYSLSTFSKPFLAIATIWPHALAVRFFDRVGKGIRDSPRDALIASSIAKSRRGRAFGLQRALDTAGAVIGTILASILLANLIGYRTIFLLSLLPAFIGVMILIFLVKEIKFVTRENIKIKRNFSTGFKRFLIVAAIFNLANFSYAFFILKASQAGIAVMLIPIVYLLYNIFYAMFSYHAGRFSDKIGRKTVIAIGYALFALTALGFAFLPSALFVWPLFALYGMQIALVEPSSRAYISELVSPAHRGTAFGAYYTTIGLVALPASLIAGFVWDLLGSNATFLLAAILAIIAAFALKFLCK